MTRAEVNIMGEDYPTVLASLYVHGDGYPEGIGVQLADICKGIKLVNGLPPGRGDLANGMGCMAARIISLLKLDDTGRVYPGSIYLQPIGDGVDDVNFKYEVKYQGENKEVLIKVWSCALNRLIFQGTPAEVINEFEDKQLEGIK